MKLTIKKIMFTLAAAPLFSGCVHSSTPSVEQIMDGRKTDYRKEEFQRGRDLRYPPNLIDSIGAEQTDSQLLSEYRIQAVPEIGVPEEVELSGARKVSYRRKGNVRWIDLDLPPGQTFNLLRKFFENFKLGVEKEDAKIGTIETEWLDLRRGPGAIGLGGEFLDKILNRVQDSGKRDKFVARVEPREDNSSVFIAHRHVSAKFDREGRFSGFSPLPSDSELETEILRRIMIHASQTPEAEAQTAFAEEIAEEEERGDYELEETRLVIRKPFAESWTLVRIGLDRGGFTIEDQDYIERAYYIRHAGGTESDKIFSKTNTSFFNKLFGDDAPVSRGIKLALSELAPSELAPAESEGGGENGAAAEAAPESGEAAEQVSAYTVVTASSEDKDEELTPKQISVLLELLSVNLP